MRGYIILGIRFTFEGKWDREKDEVKGLKLGWVRVNVRFTVNVQGRVQ